MFATESPSTLEVNSIKPTAGRCFKCHKFRYCERQTESGKIICKDCVQTLRNQRLLVEIVPQNKPILTPPQQKKARRAYKKKEITYVRREKVAEARDARSKQKILDFVKASEKALTANEIIKSGQCGHKNTVYKILARLVESGDIFASSGKAKNRLFADKDRLHLLNVRKIVRRREYAQMNRTRVLKYIKRENRILEVADVVNATNITKKTVIRVVNFFEETGDLTLIKVSERGNRLHFVPSNNSALVKQLMELDQLSTANQVRRILESSNRGVSIGDVLIAIGKGRRNGGCYKYIKKLFKQWGCKNYRQGCGLYYYLDKEGKHE